MALVVVGDDVPLAALAPASAGAGDVVPAKSNIRWTPLMSKFMLEKLVDIIRSGVKIVKGFKECHNNQVAAQLSAHFHREISGAQVHNHQCKCRGRWQTILKLQNLSAAIWDEKNMIIIMDDDQYRGHIAKYPGDAFLLKLSIENYDLMETIFGNRQATGKHALGSDAPLGTPVINLDGPNDGFVDDGSGSEGEGLYAPDS